MKKKITSRHLPLMLCIMLVVSMALFTAGCNGGKKDAVSDSGTAEGVKVEGNVLGEGDTQFAFTVVDGENNETKFEIHTDKKTVGEALLDVGLIAGEEGDYGLYVKTVNGLTVDFEEDGAYWAFYIGDEYATTGVDSTEIEEGATYTFKVEKQ
jgi:hypothetical protein